MEQTDDHILALLNIMGFGFSDLSHRSELRGENRLRFVAELSVQNQNKIKVEVDHFGSKMAEKILLFSAFNVKFYGEVELFV